MIKAVIFDLDNTLLDFISVKKKAVDAAVLAMIEAGLDADADLARKSIFDIYDNKGYEYQEVFDEFLTNIHGKIDYKILASGIVSVFSKIRPFKVLGPERGKFHPIFLLISLTEILASIK